MNSRQCYELQKYLYSDTNKEENLEEYLELSKIWDDWHCMILIEANQSFFDLDYDSMESDIRQELNRKVSYLNLNVRQSIVLFEDPNCDYRFIAKHIYTFLKLRYPTRFHMAVSEIFEGHKKMPGILRDLERCMESKSYHIEDHVLSSEREELAATDEEVMDSRLIEKITYDVNRKDAETMWKHYGELEEKYRESSLFSAVYVKFVFGKVVEALYQDKEFFENGNLVNEITEIYCSRNESEVLHVAKRNAEAYAAYARAVAKESTGKIEEIIAYIDDHFYENIDAKDLADKFKMLPGYLMFQFRVHTGENLNRFLYRTRMEKADELLKKDNVTWVEAGKRVGYKSSGYFARAYVNYYGESPS